MERREAGIAVITPTTGRFEVLRRCIASVKAQDTAYPVRHVIIGDSLGDTQRRTALALCEELRVTFINDERPRKTVYGPARASMARNLGIDATTERYVAHLDDDNTIDPGHLSSLAEFLDRDDDIDVAHSFRRMLGERGEPCRLQRYPWVIYGRPGVAREVFDRLVEAGLFAYGSEIIRDRMDGVPPDLCHVDSSELMMRRRVFDRVRFQETYTAREMIYQYSEDYLFCRAAQEAGLRFGCTEKVTLNYYLGGYGSGPLAVLEQ